MALVISDAEGAPPSLLPGGREERIVKFTLDTDYEANGYAVEASDLGLSTIETVTMGLVAGFVPQWTYNDANTGHLVVLYGNYDAADGPLIEVPNGHDAIAGLIVRAVVVGAR